MVPQTKIIKASCLEAKAQSPEITVLIKDW